jgi:hypothetical protein
MEGGGGDGWGTGAWGFRVLGSIRRFSSLVASDMSND